MLLTKLYGIANIIFYDHPYRTSSYEVLATEQFILLTAPLAAVTKFICDILGSILTLN